MKIPGQLLVKLPRQIIKVSGDESAKFLNGLVTSRMLPEISKKNQYTLSLNDSTNHLELDTSKDFGIIHEDHQLGVSRDSIYSMLLTSKGRVLSDLFIYPGLRPSPTPTYYLELHPSLSSKILTMLKLHKLKTRVDIQRLDNLHLWYYYNTSLQFSTLVNYVRSYFTPQGDALTLTTNAESFINDALIFDRQNLPIAFGIDDRIPDRGVKFISTHSTAEHLFNAEFEELFEPRLESSDLYDLRNIVDGVPEKLYIVKDTLPFEHNLDLMNGISYDKGCYVGQELTIRTKNQGVIRKRILPFEILTDLERSGDEQSVDTSFQSDYTGVDLPSTTRRPAGKILHMKYNRGLILFNLSHLKGDHTDFEFDGHILRVYLPGDVME